MGGGGEWVQLFTPIYFNTPFSSCFTKKNLRKEKDRNRKLLKRKQQRENQSINTEPISKSISLKLLYSSDSLENISYICLV